MDKNTTMENLARAAYEKGGFNGAWLYAEKGKIVSSGAFGWVDAENSLPMREDSIFEMASVTKMFTATAIMLLVREGKLGLDDAYTKYFPDYPYEGVTIRHLLTHTSGMPDFDVGELVGPVLDEENRIPANSEIIDLIRETGEDAACAWSHGRMRSGRRCLPPSSPWRAWTILPGREKTRKREDYSVCAKG